MFGSNILGGAIGLVFVYALLSLLCSVINEQVIARLFALRSKTLEDGIKTMLNDPRGRGAARAFYHNPLIRGLTRRGVFDKMFRRDSKPSYISSNTFALVINDIVAYDPDVIPPALKILLDQAKGDVQQELARIEKWFDDTMDQVSGWYKQKVQLIILALGFIIVVYLNLDTISILSTLSSNKAQIQDLIGWQTPPPVDSSGWILKIVGLLATTFVVTLGASFWFDVLNKFMSFRSDNPSPQTGASTGSHLLTNRGIDAANKEYERKSASSVTGLGNEVEAIPKLPPTQLLDQTGGTRMTIEQNALRVAEFLETLNEKIISDPEFRRLYGDMGRMDQLVPQTAIALTTNFQRLEEARSNLMVYPNRRQYQEDVDSYLQGLAAAARRAENVWREFQTNTLARTTSLISQVEGEAAKSLDQPVPAAGVDAVAAEGTPTATAPAKSSWLKTALNGLIQFKDFLTVAVDLDKAVNQASPALMDGVKSAFDLLGQFRF